MRSKADHRNKFVSFTHAVLTLVGIIGLTGCAGDPWARPNAQPLVSSPDVVNVRIAEAVERSSKALETMALVEQARTPVDTSLTIGETPEELKQTVTLTWVGPVETIAALLADVAGYSYASIGNPPPTPVIVSVEATERPVIEILRSLGLQAGRTADVTVNAASRVVEVRYAPVPAL